MKKIDKLVYDIHEYLNGNHADVSGNIKASTENNVITLAKNITTHTLDLASIRAVGPRFSSDTMLRMSELGEPCLRKLVYKRFHPNLGLPPNAEKGPPTLPVKFLFGDYVEEIALYLAQEAGHAVTDRQREVEIRPSGTSWYAVGHLDAVIDGHVVDVKSASDFAFAKYKREGLTLETDGFGYRYQIDAYATALKTDQRGFLFMNKQDGGLYWLDRTTEPLIDIDQRIRDIGTTVSIYLSSGTAPDRLPTVVEKKTGFNKLGVVCSYCPFKHACYSGTGDTLQGYIVSSRPVYYVNVDPEDPFLETKIKIPSP